MRVCIVPHRYPPELGGVAVASQRYALGLHDAGHQVLVVALDERLPPGSVERAFLGAIEFRRVGTHRRSEDTLSAWFDSIVAEHRAKPFDVIVGRYVSSAAFVAVLSARFLGLPSLISARGNDLDRGAFEASTFSRLLWTLQSANRVTTVSHELAQKIKALVPEVEPHVVHNGVDGEFFSPGQPERELLSGLAAEVDGELGPVVLFVGEARGKKGLPLLLEAFARCVNAQPRATLVLLGGVRAEDSPLIGLFSQKYPNAGLRVLPSVPAAELVRYYRLASLFVMPSIHDGLPNALLEAMASGCPIVASAVGGIPEAIRDGVEGLLVAPGDARALADAMLSVLSQPRVAAELGKRARQRVLSAFMVEREHSADLALLRGLAPSLRTG